MKIFDSFDGVQIAYRLFGEGRPTLLLHTFLGSADLDWFQTGIAQAIAATGRLVIAPDLRGHGASDAPTDLTAYPPDALAMDQEALLRHLNVGDYDLVSYALGARMAVRMLVRGATPGRCVLGGMGDNGIMQVAGRRSYYDDAIRNGPGAANTAADQYVRDAIAQRGLKAEAMLNVLVQQVDTLAKALGTVDVPILVVSGQQDEDNGSAERLADTFPHGRALRVPGDHLTALAAPELTAAILEFLGA
jgi:pimeloyl-ACP methyl ester carboxylesterase